jgi:uncharacterized protein YhaN
MRLRTLNLERYGPFTHRSINLSPNAKLPIVEGPNEAGKTCALAAVTDLFFGIERQTAYDFLHDGRELRIGATMWDGRGIASPSGDERGSRAR